MKEQKDGSIVSNLIWKFSERILAQLISFVVSIVLARILLPDEYGIISIVLVFISFADVFVTSGFSTALIQKKDADETDFSTIFYCSLLTSGAIYLFLFLIAPYVAKFYKMQMLCPVLRVLAIRLPISAYNSVQHAYVSRNMLFRKFFFSTLFGTLISGVFGIVSAVVGFGVWALVIQYLTNTIIDSIILSFTIRWRPRRLFSLPAAKKLMSYGWKILAADFSGVFFDQLRTLIIGKVYMASDLAYYNRGKSFGSLIIDNISTAGMSVLFPAMSNKSGVPKELKQTLRTTIKVMSYIIFPAIGGLIVVAKPLVILVLTEKWKNSILFLQILSASSAIALLGSISLQSIKAIGRSDIVLKLEFIKKPVYVVFLLIGVMQSVRAVAITMLIYSLYSTIINAQPLKKLLDYSYREQLKDIGMPFVLTILMGMIASMWKLMELSNITLIILEIMTGVVTYLFLSCLLKVDAFEYLLNYIKRNK
jgi:O-antigen/teichoic acid export membrane protein